MTRIRNERGAAAVEFALVLPIFIMLVFGIVEFGRAYNAKLTLTHAVNEGARELALGHQSDAKTLTVDQADSLDLKASDVDVDTCTNADAGELVSVKADYAFSYSIPLFGEKTITLQATGTQRCTA